MVLDPSITVGVESLPSLTDQQKETLRVLVPKAVSSKEKIARGICIIRGSVKADISNALVVYPPKSKINFETHYLLFMYNVNCLLKDFSFVF